MKRDERKRRRGREIETVPVSQCRFFNVRAYTHTHVLIHTHAYTHTHIHTHTHIRMHVNANTNEEDERSSLQRLNIGVSVGVIKRSLAPDEILRRTHEGRLKRNRSPPPSVTGLAPVFSTPLRFTAACANDILTARSQIVTESVWKASRHSE